MKHRYFRKVATLELDPLKCNGCGMCLEVCPHNVFTMKNRKALVTLKDNCMECGACSKNCPTEAIYVKSGAGCAYKIIKGNLSGKDECDCSNSNNDCC